MSPARATAVSIALFALLLVACNGEPATFHPRRDQWPVETWSQVCKSKRTDLGPSAMTFLDDEHGSCQVSFDSLSSRARPIMIRLAAQPAELKRRLALLKAAAPAKVSAKVEQIVNDGVTVEVTFEGFDILGDTYPSGNYSIAVYAPGAFKK